MGSVEKLIEETGLGSVSWFGDELLTALNSEDVEEIGGDDDEDDDLDDISSMSFSDISYMNSQQTPAGALAGHHAQAMMLGGEVDEARRELRKQAAAFAEREEEAKHQRALIERRLQHAKQRHQQEMTALRAKHQSELQPTASALQKAKMEAVSLRDRLSANKDELLAGLPVSEARLRELKELPMESLGLRESVQRHLGELLQQAAHTRDAHRREIDVLRENLAGTSRELAERQTRLDEVHASASAREIEHGKRVGDLQSVSMQLQRDNEELKGKMIQFLDKAGRCDEAEAKLAAAGERVIALQEELRVNAEELKRGKSERAAVDLQAEERAQQVVMLQMDKTFLAKELDGLRGENVRLAERADKQSHKAKEAKRSRDLLQEQIANHQALAGIHVEDRLQTELSALRQRAEEEIREVKRSTQEFYARQLDTAQQAKEEAQAELQRLRMRADQLQMERDQAMREHMLLTATVDESMGEVRGRLRMREFELERLTVSHEDVQGLLRQLRLENEMYRGKLDVLKTEFYKLQTDSTKRATELEHACENAQAKLAAYQSIELHLNKAVEGIDLFSEATGEDAERQILSLGAGLPTDPQRRLVQIMSLASKVVEQQKKLQQLTRSVEDQEKVVVKLRDELQEANRMLDNTSQPHSMFVDTVRARDEEIRAAGREIERLRQQLIALGGERDHLRTQTLQLRQDLQRALDHKHTAASVQIAVTELAQQQRMGKLKLQDVTNVLGGLSAGTGNLLERTGVFVPNMNATSSVTTQQPPAVWFTKLRSRVAGAQALQR